MGNIIFIVLYL